MTQLLQQGTLREILLWNTDDFQKENSPDGRFELSSVKFYQNKIYLFFFLVQSIGRLNFITCQTQPLDFEVTTNKEKGIGKSRNTKFVSFFLKLNLLNLRFLITHFRGN